VQALANCHTPLYKGKRQILARAKVGKVPLLLGFSRRSFLKSLSRSATVLSLENILGLSRPGNIEGWGHEITQDVARPATPSVAGTPLGLSFVNVGKEAGLNAKTIFGGEHKNKYLLETTGCGVAFCDYDNDGWLDIFLVNGWRLEGFPAGQEPSSHLFKNNRDGTFTDVTSKAGLRHSGWGQGVCIGDYDNDGFEDLFVTYFGKNVLYHNNGDGTFTDVSEKAGVAGSGKRWNSGCAFVDYDRDGRLDLFVANYIDLDLATAPVPESGPCNYKGVLVACGPPGLNGGKNILYHNNGDGTFTDVSQTAGILNANGTYGLGVLTADFDNDGWPDIYVANDSTASALYKNLGNGKFTDVAMEAGCALSADGKPQAGMGVSAIDYDLDGNLDIVKTNFAGILVAEILKTLLFRRDWGNTRNTWGGAAVFLTWTMMGGRTFLSVMGMCTQRSSSCARKLVMRSASCCIGICGMGDLKMCRWTLGPAFQFHRHRAGVRSAILTMMGTSMWW
jgi:hypothetical protein